MGGIVLMGLVAGLGTCLGALIVIACSRLRPSFLSLLLGLAAGVMAAVVAIDLLPTSLRYGSLPAALAGFLGGAGLMGALGRGLNRFFPSALKGANYLKMGCLIATGIALHDFPEGLAIAAGFAAAQELGPLLVLAIGLHNIPEGMACAVPLRCGGLGAGRVLAINALISLVTPLGTFTGLALVRACAGFIGLLLAFAAGAMTCIVLCELGPESRRHHRLLAHLGMLAGISTILFLEFIV
ncbi:MAG: ZIP family metal transporter [Peptococcaceae bacterium]|nr:ZIP family metal transporter [Peptococcaceae bacterium]